MQARILQASAQIFGCDFDPHTQLKWSEFFFLKFIVGNHERREIS